MRRGIDLFIHQVHVELALVPVVVSFGSESKEAGGDDFFRLITFVFKFHEIPGELLLEEQVIGFVLFEGFDHVVAVAPGVGIKDPPAEGADSVSAIGIAIAELAERLDDGLAFVGLACSETVATDTGATSPIMPTSPICAVGTGAAPTAAEGEPLSVRTS